MMTTIYVKALSADLWFGAWVPINAHPCEDKENTFIIAENKFTEDDEYEFFVPGTVVKVKPIVSKKGETFLGAVEAVKQVVF